MATWPGLTFLEVLLAFAGGFLLSRGEAHGVRSVRLALAVIVAIAIYERQDFWRRRCFFCGRQ